MKAIGIIILTIFFAAQLSAQCDKNQDSLELIKLYESTDGAFWVNAWDLDLPLEQWHGISTNSGGCVTKIELESNNLNGNLPNLNLGHLEVLNLNRNNIDGSLPDFSGCQSLKSIYAIKNNFSGDLPNFEVLQNIEHLIFWDNTLSGSFPDFNLPNLLDIDFTDNNLSGNIPLLASSTKLRSFTCGGNSFTGTIPNISNKSELYRFHCYENKLTGSIPNFIGLDKLKFFFCRDNNLSGVIPNFENFNTLEWFNCENNNIVGNIPDHNNHPIVDYRVDNNNLVGCYPDWVCDVAFSSEHNQRLPWEGLHQNYCNNMSQIGAPCNDGIDNNGEDLISVNCICNDQSNATDEIIQNQWSLYPNPVSEQLTIKGELYLYQIDILNSTGQIHQTIAPDGNLHVIDISNLPSGLYFVRIQSLNNHLIEVQKLIKE